MMERGGDAEGTDGPAGGRVTTLEARLRQQAALASLGHAAVWGGTPWELAQSAARAVGEALEVEHAEVLALEESGTDLRVRGVYGDGTPLGGIVRGGSASQAGYTLLTGSAVVVDDLSTERRFAQPPALVSAAVVSGVSVTIQGRERPFGVLGVHTRRRRAFSHEDVGFLEAVASLLAAALERARAEEARQRSEASFRTLIENAPDLVIVLLRRGRVLWANSAMRQLLGLSDQDLVGHEFRELVPRDDRDSDAQHVWDAEASGIPTAAHEGRLLRGDGTEAVVDWVGIPVDYEGQPAWVGIGRDVTGRRRLQAHMAMTDRLVSVGTLAAGVAHELNNPLTYVLGNLEVIVSELQRLAPGLAGAPAAGAVTELVAAATEAREGARRMRQIVIDLRGVARGDERADAVVDLGDVVRAAVNLTRAEIKRCATLEVSVVPVPPVRGNPARLGQLLVNLLVNAAQAIDPSSKSEQRIFVSMAPAGDGHVVLEVRDTGVGIAPAALPRIFEPFFTTKPVGVGTGLGLWICHAVVSAAGGRIEVESRVGEGTRFRVLLPVAGATRDEAPAPAAGLARGNRRILVIDDEPEVGVVIKRLLSRHDVSVVHSGAAALERLRAGERYDAILCDLLMPHMSGLELRERLLGELPEQAARLLFVSGAADTPVTEGRAKDVACVQKPFEAAQLLAEIERVSARS